jgi:hypothetical protein
MSRRLRLEFGRPAQLFDDPDRCLRHTMSFRARAGTSVALFAEACALVLQGIVARLASAPYRVTEPHDWLKIKNPLTYFGGLAGTTSYSRTARDLTRPRAHRRAECKKAEPHLWDPARCFTAP